MPGGVKSRTFVFGTTVALVAFVAVVVFVFACTGGPSGQGSGNPSGPDSGVVLTVEQALAAEEGQDLSVRGAVLSTSGKTVLASAVAESYPPQAGGATLPVAGLDLAALVGLSSTAGQAGMADVTWSDYWPTLRGVVKAGVLQVEGVPRVVEDTSVEGIRIRFSPVSEPVSSGDQVWWAFDVTNTGQVPIQLTFSDGQKGDVILSQDGVDKYTWSEGKAFTQQVETIILDPGRSYSVVLNDTLDALAGDYDLTARVTALVGSGGSEQPLPDLISTLSVH
jgi:Intracellular proteinase inhibitor